ncbi:MAG: Unknown protein [uncultured Campylobacterales bacterium]|uniref:Pentapeptide repeat-containing protein n=1 Tax=uncultured Campylobacterales bacterium TaxID=352960 RepID=A0A6S6RWX6_9BACT|nr:MAG: Unknown protein [uncultured Campylobacterales bacterium]
MKCEHCKKEDEYSKEFGKCIFHCDKKDWYKEEKQIINKKEEIIKIWVDDKKVEEFWDTFFKEKIDEDNCDFSYVIFPKFIRSINFGNITYKSLIFKNAIFLDEAIFEFISFTKKVDFSNTTFEDKANFMLSKFEETTIFKDSNFKKDVNFSGSTFQGFTIFQNCKFNQACDFAKATFYKETAFLNLHSNNDIISFNKARFFDITDFFQIKLNAIEFRDTSFYKKATFHGNTFYKKCYFQNTNFLSNTIFSMCNLEETSFLSTNLDNITFEACTFWNDKNKIIFDHKMINTTTKENYVYKKVEMVYDNLYKKFSKKNELDIALILLENKVSIAEERIDSNLEEKEILYAETKNKYDQLTLYQKGDEYYKKELEMRIKIQNPYEDKLCCIVHKPFYWLNWYNWISKFNTSPTRALSVLLVSIVVFMIIYTFFQDNYSIQKTIESFKYSFTTSIPIISIPKNMDVLISKKNLFSFIYYFQVIFSTTVWTLLILSIRRKFKR